MPPPAPIMCSTPHHPAARFTTSKCECWSSITKVLQVSDSVSTLISQHTPNSSTGVMGAWPSRCEASTRGKMPLYAMTRHLRAAISSAVVFAYKTARSSRQETE
ncbi:hypothetical protein PsYK624_105890 [Phanerochaete sordida]|uniref:Uncharacterized protein n=1 Tax=Phanerochaete sordida TaxID=48140 RepID=A0A9P3LGK5_9APHY|nr:hypothetical protein PsYK624_105890 [Phanerochaete sordida]